MDAPPVCPTRHEDDTPSATDAFDVHHRIARTIERVIEETAAAKTIGLSGTWGAGKSSVVRMLEEIYADRTGTRVVWTFDAWAHEGDPLRRTFLESLIAALARQGWLVADQWATTLDVLSKRRKVTEQHSAPRLTGMGVLVAISVLLVPVGTTLFSNQIRSGISLGWNLSPDWLAIAGLLLAMAPLLALVTWAAWVLIRPRRDTTTSGGRPVGTTWQDELVNALTVFVQRTDTNSYTETLDSGDPTSLEFERDFRRIMEAALDQHPERRLVLVIDNLDRVGPQQALAIWSTLQTFLQRRGSGGWVDRLWCLLPFDAEAIRRLWQKDNAPGSSVAESFLDKTFQLRFDVPLPRLANWKDYLVAALGRAMPEHTTTDEFFKIYRLFSVRRSAHWQAPTPRQLKLFVNQVGSLHRHWQHEIPLEDLAYYVLLQHDGLPIVSSLLDGSLPAAAEAGLVSDRVQSSLAALVYGSSVEQSHEVLLRQPILKALQAGDSTRLDGLAVVSDKFWLVLELALEQGCAEWPTAEGGLLLHAAAALADTGLVHDESPWRIAALFHRIGVAVRATRVWTPMDTRAIDGAIAMASRDATLGRTLFDGFTRARFVPAETMTPSQAREFAADYARLSAALGNPRPATRLDAATPDAYVDLAAALAEVDPNGDTWTHFGTRDMAAIEKALLARSVDPGWSNVVRVAVTAGRTQWPDLIERAAKGLKDDEGYSPAQQVELVGALHTLADVGEQKDAAKLLDDLTSAIAFAVDPECTADRALVLALSAVTATADGESITLTDADTAGAWLYTLLARHGTLLGVDQRRRKLEPAAEDTRQALARALFRTTPEICRALARATLHFGHAQRLFKSAKESDQFRHWPHDRMLMAQVLEALAELGAPPRVLPPELVIDEWGTAFPKWSCYTLARAMRSRRPELAAALLKSPPHTRLASAYAGTLDANASADNALVTLSAAVLAAAPAEDWHASLHEGEMGLPRLHAALAQRGTKVVLAAQVIEAIRTFVTTPPANVWMDPQLAAALMNTLPASEREQVVDELVDAFASAWNVHSMLPLASRATVSTALLLAQFAGDALFAPERLRVNPRLLAPVAANVVFMRDDSYLTVLSGLLRDHPDLLRAVDADVRAGLAERLRQREAAASPSARADVATLAAMFTSPQAGPDVQRT